jgi:uncharacterized protein
MVPQRCNRLVNEKSPYLRQHAQNPVQWYPWSDETFETAQKQDKPVFLSIGYSTCHWCHVMERESFSDDEVASLMNELFIAIKVDREERPDIDAFYMDICQLLSGSGGWPLTIIMTPDKKPFFAGTYFPKESRFGLIGLKELLPRVGDAWRESRSGILASAEKIRAALTPQALSPGQELPPDILERTFAQLVDHFDHENGGFGTAPKFPTPHHLTFLLRWVKRTDDERPLKMVEKTLQAMRRGGIFDHLGFGFHRYSTDARWLVPHFEKMLYDQALLTMAYTEAYAVTGNEEYRQTAEDTITYVLRDMTSEDGSFFAAEDADSDGEEGKYYLWKEEEVRNILKPGEAELAIRVFNILPDGNFEEAGTGRTGENILWVTDLPVHPAAKSSFQEKPTKARLARLREQLFRVREKRPRPLRDMKILADWNGLMIAALAKASQAFDREDYASAAKNAADFVRAKMTAGRELYHRYIEGEVKIPGFLDDYAFLIWGLIDLYETIFDLGVLEWALELTDLLLRKFWDKKEGGFFFSSEEAQDLPLRRKEIYDGAVPSGNSVMTANLLRLGRMTGRTELEIKANEIAKFFSPRIAQAPVAYTQFMNALDFARGPSYEVVIVGQTGAEDTQVLLRSLRRNSALNKVVLFRPSEARSPGIIKLAPYLKPMTSVGGKATAYVCSHFRCELPTTEPAKMLALLNAA